MSKWVIVRMVILLGIGLLIRDITAIVYYFWPQSADLYFKNLFWDKSYTQEMTILYFIYEITQYVKDTLDFYVFYRVSSFLSKKLSKICLVFSGYYAIQFLFYLYNRNTSYLNNISLVICLVIVIVILFRHKDYEMKSV